MEYQALLQDFVTLCKESLCQKLIGVYLHGSMAMGCFNPCFSDIDLLVVTKGEPTQNEKLQWINQVVYLNQFAPQKGLEVSILPEEVCNPLVYPTPFSLHFSPAHLQECIHNPESYISRMNGTDTDLAAHIKVTLQEGIALCGKPILQVFGQVPDKDFLDSVYRDIAEAETDIRNHTMYITLNLCRVLAFIKERLCISKKDGGVWGLRNTPSRYHPLLQAALRQYTSSHTVQYDMNLADDFARFMLEEIYKLNP